MADQVGFRSWKSFVDSDEMGLSAVWQKAIVQLALLQHMESGAVGEAPSFEDAKIVFDEACSGKLLPWWPQKLERILVKIRVTPNGSTTDMLGPHPVDPNTKDLGRTMFSNIAGNLLDACGEFDGSVQIQILRATDKGILGGFRNESVLIGSKVKKKRGGSGSNDGRDEMFEYVTDRLKEKDAQIDRMFANSAHVIGSAAHLVNATRGVNPAPPWMNGEDGAPLWYALINGAMQIGGAVLTGKDPKSQIQKIMQEPTHPMLTDGSRNQGFPQLPDHGNQKTSEQSYGSDQFLDEGQYDGFRVVDEDLLDDGFDEEEEGEWNEEEEWEEDDDSSEEDEPPRKRSKGKKGKRLFEGMSDSEVEAEVDKWMNGKDKGRLKEIGMRLASKILR